MGSMEYNRFEHTAVLPSRIASLTRHRTNQTPTSVAAFSILQSTCFREHSGHPLLRPRSSAARRNVLQRLRIPVLGVELRALASPATTVREAADQRYLFILESLLIPMDASFLRQIADPTRDPHNFRRVSDVFVLGLVPLRSWKPASNAHLVAGTTSVAGITQILSRKFAITITSFRERK
ncbi:hypothetical protein C8R45DRAFT_1104546 [Mycena sanguinolenta]|nr:hypothetical protein C8R45DRAFT_1104546 [Mycena sanguinolenta]